MTKIVLIVFYFLPCFVLNAKLISHEERIIVFYNGDKSVAQLSFDESLQLQAIENLRNLLQKESRNFVLQTYPVHYKSGSTSPFKQALESEGAPIKGIVFLGHGGNGIYAVNKLLKFSGEKLATLLLKDLNKSNLSDSLFFYFDGCSLARTEEGKVNFQNQFYNTLSKKMEPPIFTKVEVLAHIYDSSITQPFLKKTSKFQRFFYKSNIGAFFQKIDAGFIKGSGGLGPSIASLLMYAMVIDATVIWPSHGLEIFIAGIGLLVLKTLSIKSLGYYGRKLSFEGENLGEVRDLFFDSLNSKVFCRRLFE